ncbi:hypothetical protein EJB05_34730, partial [Eragrostis curvula]
ISPISELWTAYSPFGNTTYNSSSADARRSSSLSSFLCGVRPRRDRKRQDLKVWSPLQDCSHRVDGGVAHQGALQLETPEAQEHVARPPLIFSMPAPRLTNPSLRHLRVVGEAPEKLHQIGKLGVAVRERLVAEHIVTGRDGAAAELNVARDDPWRRAEEGQYGVIVARHGALVLERPQLGGVHGEARAVAAAEGEPAEARVEDGDGPHAAARVECQVREPRTRGDQALDVLPESGIRRSASVSTDGRRRKWPPSSGGG